MKSSFLPGCAHMYAYSARRFASCCQRPQAADRLEGPAPAVHVRDPAAFRPRVVEVEHRGDRVDAQAVGMALAKEVEPAREEEVAHFVAAGVEDERPPVRMRTAARIG